MTIKSGGMKSQVPKRIGLLLVLASMLAIVILYALDITFLYEPKHLLGITNTIFTAIIPIIVAFFAARTYLLTGSISVLLMGCGMLGFGLCAGSAGWLREMRGGANINVTLYNTGALLGSLCHFTGAAIHYSRRSSAWELERQKLAVIPAYAAIIVFSVLLTFATVQRVVPPFFIQGSGPTALRQIVLGLAIFLYGLSSLFFLNNYFRSKSDFLYWYSLCLAMLALGLFAFYIQKIVGSPIGWVGRTSNYVGTVFALMAILAAVRSGQSKGLPLEEVISGFFVDAEANYKSLVETASDAIISFDQGNRIILWNSSAERLFGYTKGEATGLPLLGMLIPEEHAHTLKGLIETSQGPNSQSTVEMVGRHKNGGLFPIEISAFRRKLPNGWVNTCILRDITGRKQAEEALKRAHNELEVRVLERTAELAQRNEELTIEIVERRKMEQALQDSKKQLQILASQILSAQENERKRIALEVHDVLGSSLSAIKFKAEEALLHLPKDGTLNISISKPLETLIPLVQDTIEEARRIQTDLRPPILDDLGIVATLSWFCRRFETIYSHIAVEPTVTLREEEVPDHLRIVLFRITQEAMNNIGKHAKADWIDLGLQKIGGILELTVEDNGKGFDPELSSSEGSPKGLGLSSMKERVEFSGGSFSIESVKGKGTVIRAVWPV